MSEKEIQFEYFHGYESEQYKFYRVPKILITNPYFRHLSCEAKLLYGLLLDRMGISVKNHWIDEQDRVYIIFPIDEIMELFACGRQKAVKMLQELDTERGIGLIEKKRIGLGRANIIYVKNFLHQDICDEGMLYGQSKLIPMPGKVAEEMEEDALETANSFMKCENQISGSLGMNLSEVPESNFSRSGYGISTGMEKEIQEIPKSYLPRCENQTCESRKIRPVEIPKPDLQKYENQNSGGPKNRSAQVWESNGNKTNHSDTDRNYTEKKETESSGFHTSYPILSETGKDKAMEVYREIICDNIEYSGIAESFGMEQADGIVDLILEVVTSRKKTFWIAGQEMDANLVKNRFMKLNFMHISYVCDCLRKNTTKIKNIKQYLLTALYNAPTTIDYYYQAEVQHDMYG